MRTIVFRAQDLASNKWLYGDLRHHKDDVCIFEQGGTKGKQVKKETVGQFTGLRDKSGKDIYEGDIIYTKYEDNSNAFCLVGWNEEKASFGLMDRYEYKAKQKGFTYPCFDPNVLWAFRSDAKIFKVVGNIYDNPDMMMCK